MEEVKTTFDWASLVTPLFTLIGIFAGSIGTYLINSKLEDKKNNNENLRYKREKLEELYFNYLKWENNYINVYLQHYSYFLGNLSYKQLLELSKNFDKDVPDLYKKFHVVLNLYFDELQHSFSKIENCRANMSKFLGENSASKYSKESFLNTQKEFETSSENFKNKIIELSNNL